VFVQVEGSNEVGHVAVHERLEAVTNQAVVELVRVVVLGRKDA